MTLELTNLNNLLRKLSVPNLERPKPTGSKLSVVKLSNALKNYKKERIKTEEDLIHMIKKVNLDKAISIKEKHKILWDEETPFDQRHLENNLKKAQLGRFQQNEK